MLFLNYIITNFKKNSIWFRLLFILCIIIIIILIINETRPIKEGFSFTKEFTEKTDNNIFDEFYTSVYDSLVYSGFKNEYEIGQIINNTSPTSNSIILDVGSGTGHHVNAFKNKGYNVSGIDKSTYMIKIARENFPDAKFIEGDFMKPMSFNYNEFTHITCLYFTLYYIKNKQQFFDNCYAWLKPGGYFIIHLVNKDLFDPVIPASSPFIIVNPQKYAKERITTSNVAFDTFTYKAHFDPKSENNSSIYPNDVKIFMEVFKDKKTGKIRQNKHKFYMESQKQILQMLKSTGFMEIAQIDMKNCQYDNQYLYILQKPS